MRLGVTAPTANLAVCTATPSRPVPGSRATIEDVTAAIEQAKGILMATYRCGPDEAQDLLRRASQASGLKMHMLAAKVVDLAKRELTMTDAGHRNT